MKRAAVACATLALIAATTVSLAGAHTVKYESTVSAKLKQNGKKAGAFSGTVESTSVKCEVARRVIVFKSVDGGLDTDIGDDFTDADGDWEFQATGELAPGNYYAAAATFVVRKNKKHRHKCRKAFSEGIEVK